MSFLNSMNISASGMTAQRLRRDVASENIANMEKTRNEA
ncbi:MAG: flagellar basal body protein, partial [Lachnospiraceae bacterium]|nr:flagellar basal body protein [Lachnospiraceae bacterium]